MAVTTPSEKERAALIESLLFILSERKDNKSIIVVSGDGTARESLIHFIKSIYPSRSVTLHPSDICRVWREFEMRQISLQLIILKDFSSDFSLKKLPMVDNQRQIFALGSTRTPGFRYVIEAQEIIVPPHLQDNVVYVTALNVDYNSLFDSKV